MATKKKASGTAYSAKKKRSGVKGKRNGSYWLLVLLSLALAFGAYYLFTAYSDEKKAEEKQAYLNRDTFFDGISIDGINVGGMTYAQAQKAVENQQSALAKAVEISIRHEQDVWTLSEKDFTITYDTVSVLNEAYDIGRRQASVDVNYNEAVSVANSGRKFSTTRSISGADFEALLDEIEDKIEVDVRDAAIESFTPQDGFSYTSERDGVKVDIEALRAEIESRIKNENFMGSIAVKTDIVKANVTVEQLKSSYALLSAFTTEATSDKKRNNNIKLALEAIDGSVIAPGEEFSFNDSTGRRTVEKGYQEAGVIKNGVLIPEAGGGVCQVSTTLFNAVALADLEIADRSPHSWPSSYVEIGMDAMVDFPSSDFKFVNNTGGNIYIVAYFTDEGHKITVQIYGVSRLEPGVSVKLRSVTTEVIPQPDDIVQYSDLINTGKIEETRTGRKGYRAETYRQYFKGDALLSEELLFKSLYKPIAAILTVGTKS